MGYSMKSSRSALVIKRENFDKALAAIKALEGQETCHATMNGLVVSSHFRYVATKRFVEAGDLNQALRAWRWRPSFEISTGNLVKLKFTGENLGDENLLFVALAPFVEPGGYIETEAEDGCFRLWGFDGHKVKVLVS